MAIQLIQSTDTLETGFRVKANANFNEIIENIVAETTTGGATTGNYRFIKNGGGFLTLVLSDQYYTKTQVAQLFAQISGSPYVGAWQTGSYSAQQVVDHNGNLWRSNTNSNSDEPGTSGTWAAILDIPEAAPAPIFRELKPNQTIPYSFSLPSNFNGKYQMTVRIDRGGGFWESYPNAKVIDLLDVSSSGGDITGYFVNRVDLYGTEAGDGTNLDHLLFTFSKA